MSLSILKNASSGSITYYTGNSFDHVSHLKNCTLYCKEDFHPSLENVTLLHVKDPQLEFYKLSRLYREDYLDSENMILRNGSWIHKDAKIGKHVVIHPGCVIGKCILGSYTVIHPNCTIYAKTLIGDGTVVESNTSIGTTGVMWVWSGDTKVFLEQLGNVIIGQDCRIGSQISIVRGSANESTSIGDNVHMAHGCMIGHGTRIGKNTHFANNVAVGGSGYIESDNFLGCSSTVSPGARIEATNVIIGASSLVSTNITESGVYVGVPCKKIKESKGKLSGVPQWKNC